MYPETETAGAAKEARTVHPLAINVVEIFRRRLGTASPQLSGQVVRELQEAVSESLDRFVRNIESEVRKPVREGREELGRWVEAMGLLTTLVGDLEVNPNDPLGMAHAIEARVRADRAELARLGGGDATRGPEHEQGLLPVASGKASKKS